MRVLVNRSRCSYLASSEGAAAWVDRNAEEGENSGFGGRGRRSTMSDGGGGGLAMDGLLGSSGVAKGDGRGTEAAEDWLCGWIGTAWVPMRRGHGFGGGRGTQGTR